MVQSYETTTGGGFAVKDDKTVARDFALEGNDLSDYHGTNAEYMNYPDDRLKPFRAEGGPEAELEARAYGDEDDSDDENPEPKKASSRGRKSQSAPKAPPVPS